MRVRSNAAEVCGAAGRFSDAESRNLSFAVATQPVEVHATEVPLSLHLIPCKVRIVTQSLILAFSLNCSSSASDNGAITLQPKLRPRDVESLCATRQRLQSHTSRKSHDGHVSNRRSTWTSASPMSRLRCASVKQEWSSGTSKCIRSSWGTTRLMPCFA